MATVIDTAPYSNYRFSWIWLFLLAGPFRRDGSVEWLENVAVIFCFSCVAGAGLRVCLGRGGVGGGVVHCQRDCFLQCAFNRQGTSRDPNGTLTCYLVFKTPATSIDREGKRGRNGERERWKD